ncbi:EmrB/QacA subfamily drug resistance transporter [Amycolatopsis sulphurea]|uniref:EmrB/QacA subfamily drug resistance transporter n=1 Tax=Amycolatopsis sulphurea TaxID=76022 RepID=A0A2A9F844_9PSEU|nr:MFS transporter [Amycolatopsis sulphurea]PFG47587.1 EmrB/QacA subfamily drug resistance transporter [Amycolatopsis sulphurea]
MQTGVQPATRPGRVLVAVTFAVVVVLMGSTILNVALPTMQASLGASTTEQQWILNAYTLTFAGFLLVAGTAGDRFGLKRLLIWGLIAFALTSAVTGFLSSPTAVIALRALSGVAAAMIMPTSLAIILRAFPAEKRPRAIATWAAASGAGASFGPVLAGAVLSSGLWWGSVLELAAVLTVIGLVVALRWVPEIPSSGTGKLRMMPVLGSLAGISLLVLGVVHVNSGGWGAPGTWLPIAAGILVLAGLLLAEARHRTPLVDVRLFRHSSFTMATVALTVVTLVVFGYLYYTVFYLQTERGFSPLQAGLVMLPPTIGSVSGAPLSRWVATKIGTRATIVSGLAIMTVSFLAAMALGKDTSIALFMVDSGVLQLGFAMVLTPATTLATSTVPAERSGAGSALLNTLRQLGGALGVAVLGSALWSSYGSTMTDHLAAAPEAVRQTATKSLSAALSTGDPVAVTAAGPAFLDAMQLTNLVAAAITGLALLVVLLVRSKRHAEPELAAAAS